MLHMQYWEFNNVCQTFTFLLSAKLYVLNIENVSFSPFVYATECGEFLVLDLGGAKFRIVYVILDGSRGVEMDNEVYDIPEEIMTGTGQKVHFNKTLREEISASKGSSSMAAYRAHLLPLCHLLYLVDKIN